MSHRRPRGSLNSPTTSSTPSFTSPSPTLGADDISTLTLPEIRDRLARNSRVLNTGLFTNPAASPPAQQPPQAQIPSPSLGGINVPNGTRPARPFPQSAGTSPTDSVRDRLMLVRRHLLEREKELLMLQAADGMGGLQLGGVTPTPVGPAANIKNGSTNGIVGNGNGAIPVSAIQTEEDAEEEEERQEAESSTMAGRRYSHSATNRAPMALPQSNGQAQASGKQAAMMNIREREKGYAPNGLILPVSESIALASRDFDHQTASRLSSLSLGPASYGLDMGGIPRSSSSPKSRRGRTLYPEGSPAVAGSNAQGNLARLRTGEDENARAQAMARVDAFMSYKSGRYDDDGDGDDDDDDGEGGMFDGADGDGVDAMFDFEEPDYPESSALDGRSRGAEAGKGKRRENGTGEMVDVYGEDDERFAEGNEDYDEGGGEGMDML